MEESEQATQIAEGVEYRILGTETHDYPFSSDQFVALHIIVDGDEYEAPIENAEHPDVNEMHDMDYIYLFDGKVVTGVEYDDRVVEIEVTPETWPRAHSLSPSEVHDVGTTIWTRDDE
jgi:hypothetical protein